MSTSKKTPTVKTERITMKVKKAEMKKWLAAAKRDGVGIEEWMNRMLAHHVETRNNGMFVPLTALERAAVKLCAERYTDGDSDAWVIEQIRGQLETDLSDVTSFFKRPAPKMP